MRLFIAIDIPESAQEKIESAKEKLKGDDAGLRFTKEGHMTLKFLGDVSEARIEYVKKLLSDIKLKEFEIRLDGKLGVFPSREYIQVVWAGFEQSDELVKLKKDIDHALEEYFKKDKDFVAHVTLARVRFVRDKKGFLERIDNIKVPDVSFKVSELKLYRSILKSEGPEYNEIMSIEAK